MSPVIAVALLLVVAVVAVVFFSTWFDSFRSALFCKKPSPRQQAAKVWGLSISLATSSFFRQEQEQQSLM
ncbi:hypothetical protein H6501_03865 [Candidatus Woesearchaeota archaeon]|nr:hypothetical protein [Candidatus Woesearchaeota archaeon]